MKNNEDKEFSNSEITVTFDPSTCTQSGICAKELSDVFSFSIIPWINLDNTETEKIINQINRCPSGALKFKRNLTKAS
ncbi:(4Fe-4S)-binding protein [Flavobacteriaceae bacterium XHP0103]|uniref:(4Fe-4S)-binding protein n=1 Tax=Marixanthotalea marina TaxID=2844359 RepID=UPI002989B708|nr:(4Fe-4S)-binding protein [Marixanthotalea marina]MBU3823040.1 (4Fe-4S)-binding protein [Marixanthotalea marina]